MRRHFLKSLLSLPQGISNAYCDALLTTPISSVALFQARVNFLRIIFDADEFSPTFDVMYISMRYLYPRGFGWFSEFDSTSLVNLKLNDSWFDDYEHELSLLKAGATRHRGKLRDRYPSCRVSKALWAGNGFPDALVDELQKKLYCHSGLRREDACYFAFWFSSNLITAK
jgi:hypothetical protein